MVLGFLVVLLIAAMVGTAAILARQRGAKQRRVASLRPGQTATFAQALGNMQPEAVQRAQAAPLTRVKREPVARLNGRPVGVAAVLPVKPPQSTTVVRLTWIGVGKRFPFGDLRLDHPMIYIFDSRCGSQNEEPASIDLALPVAPSGYRPSERELPYWPTYAGLSPGQRRNYLEWLAAGRRDIPCELGYTFLFIYGLERRA